MNRYYKIQDFAASRLTGVGASDIPTLAGLNKKWGETPYTLWRLKLGIDAPQDAGPRAEWGHRLEGEVLHKFIESRYGKDAADDFLHAKMRGKSSGPFKSDTECRSPERAYCLAHADLVVDTIGAHYSEIPDEPISEPYLVEAKTAGLMSARRDDDDPDSGYSPDDFSQEGIPAAAFLQVQYQLYVYGLRIAYIAVLIDGGDYREYGPVIADPRIQEKCLALAERFWKLVQAPEEPKPETWADVATMWPEPKDFTARLGGEEEMRARAMVSRYTANKKRLKELTGECDEIVNALGIYLGENKTLTTAEGTKLASSWFVEQPTVKIRKNMAKEALEVIAQDGGVEVRLFDLDAAREKSAALENAAFDFIENERPELYEKLVAFDAIKKGWRVLRPAKL
jgi:predicted phage-related endonuclease